MRLTSETDLLLRKILAKWFRLACRARSNYRETGVKRCRSAQAGHGTTSHMAKADTATACTLGGGGDTAEAT